LFESLPLQQLLQTVSRPTRGVVVLYENVTSRHENSRHSHRFGHERGSFPSRMFRVEFRRGEKFHTLQTVSIVSVRINNCVICPSGINVFWYEWQSLQQQCICVVTGRTFLKPILVSSYLV